MRMMCATLAVTVLVGVGGCGGGGEATVKDTLAAMNALTDAVKAGDKDKAKAAAAQLKACNEKAKGLKLSQSEDKRLKEKYEGELKTATTNMMKAMLENAGKLSPADLKEIGDAMK